MRASKPDPRSEPAPAPAVAVDLPSNAIGCRFARLKRKSGFYRVCRQVLPLATELLPILLTFEAHNVWYPSWREIGVYRPPC